MKIIVLREAERDLLRLTPETAERVYEKLTWLGQHFGEIIPEPLTGEFRGFFKLRIGDWRVFYTIDGEILFVHAIRHRSNAYKKG